MTFRHAILAFALALSFAPREARAQELPMTVEEFKLWRDYKDALEDQRVQKMPENKRMGAIAKNFKVPEKKLAAAVAKGEKEGATIGAKAEEQVKAQLAATPLASRIKSVKVDTSAAHVVTYVNWVADKPENIDQEACLVALKTAKGAPITSTINLWATDPKDEQKKVFEALIAADAADKFQEDRLRDFASKRYIKLFEKVKRAE